MTAIVIIGYNRGRSLSRLLDSLARARYPDLEIPLIISIDRGPSNRNVLEIAEGFEWKQGSKKVVYQEKNLGLRKHVLQCGDYSLQYGSVILLEDDLCVSTGFYEYAIQALDFSKDKPYIGGVSLYNHQLNVHNYFPFSPTEDGYDNWYFQFASSWGQAWTSEQWENFQSWYGTQDKLVSRHEIPSYVSSWSDKSWLKYFIAFLIEKNRFFLYPRISHTTNFADVGTHVGSENTDYQVPLYIGPEKQYQFSTLSESISVYDAFYENSLLADSLKLNPTELQTNLYGLKPSASCRFELSTVKKRFRVARSFARSLKPMEMNVLFDIPGDEIFLYDTSQKGKKRKKKDAVREMRYFYKGLNLGLRRPLMKYLWKEVWRSLHSKINRN